MRREHNNYIDHASRQHCRACSTCPHRRLPPFPGLNPYLDDHQPSTPMATTPDNDRDWSHLPPSTPPSFDRSDRSSQSGSTTSRIDVEVNDQSYERGEYEACKAKHPDGCPMCSREWSGKLVWNRLGINALHQVLSLHRHSRRQSHHEHGDTGFTGNWAACRSTH
jgi:hypothetical protein